MRNGKITGNRLPCGNILRHNASQRNTGAISNADAVGDGRIPADPNIRSNRTIPRYKCTPYDERTLANMGAMTDQHLLINFDAPFQHRYIIFKYPAFDRTKGTNFHIISDQHPP